MEKLIERPELTDDDRALLERLATEANEMIANTVGCHIAAIRAEKPERRSRQQVCYGCGREGEGGNPKRLCPGCQAYQDHTR